MYKSQLLILVGAALALSMTFATSVKAAPAAQATAAWPGEATDYHGFQCYHLKIDGCDAMVVEPKQAAPGKPWIWRAMFWDAFPNVDLALLDKGFYLAYIEVGNTFGCPDAMAHWDPFYKTLTETYGLSKYPALEGLSRGGLYIYRWAAVNTDKVGCIYGDAAVCDFKSWPGGKGKGPGSPGDWAELIKDYHFSSEADALAFQGNPLDIMEPLAKAHIPIIHVYGDADTDLPPDENSVIARERYLKLGGTFFTIVKHGCAHHPHGLSSPAPAVDFIVAHTGHKPSKKKSPADRSGEIVTLQPGEWQ
ncbi:MAG: alpha/beta hydrolase [Capsulimonas sp.]|uniref:alpha/beta hydrolase n=1 Tax=Capsulimonas sp. TaxID=2494211 RepID=UPI003262E7B6